ncbi:hypothetical protein RGU39_20725 [Bacillus wiedmannii]|uniref:hypothetical protein n=1 Tax=Bacillus wiedmannii TaxID=1890302 RepID=UPI0028536684|nr:hypothetical protein [Bacillus wiedmannii]MDR4942994.1 hypothetical protein [Bacillus wiedmannii]
MIVVTTGKLTESEMQKLNDSTAKYVDALFNEITKDCSKEAMVIVNAWWSGKCVNTEEYEKLPHFREASDYIMTLVSSGLG